MHTSEKNIVGIRTFMLNYIFTMEDMENGIDIMGKISHNAMDEYLYENGYKHPDRVQFNKIKKEDLLVGRVVLVKDETSKIIPYYNPRFKEVSSLEQELFVLQAKRHALEENMKVTTDKSNTDNQFVKELIKEKEDILSYKLQRGKKVKKGND